MITTLNKKKIIFFIAFLLLFFLLIFVGFKMWLYYSFNQLGNLLLYGLGGRIFEMTSGRLIVWTFQLPETLVTERYYIPFVQRAPNGNTLISEDGAGIVYEVDRRGSIIWKCDTLYKEKGFAFRLKSPSMPVGLSNGDILVGDEEYGKIVEVNKDCDIVWEWDYENYDPHYQILLKNYRYDDGNTGVLVYNNLCDETLKVAEHQASVFYEYIELDKMRNEVKRFNLSKFSYVPASAQILPNKHILISYERYGVIEFDGLNNEVWSFRVPDSLFVRNVGMPKVAAGARSSYRLKDGKTVIHSFSSSIYIVGPGGRILSSIKTPYVASKFGLEYVRDGEGKVFISDLLGIVSQ